MCLNSSTEICTYQVSDTHRHAHTHRHTHAHFSKECYSSGMAQVAEGCQDVSLEGDLHEDQRRPDMAIA